MHQILTQQIRYYKYVSPSLGHELGSPDPKTDDLSMSHHASMESESLIEGHIPYCTL